jgi:hypothetical protein
LNQITDSLARREEREVKEKIMSFENDCEMRKVMATPDFSDKSVLLAAIDKAEETRNVSLSPEEACKRIERTSAVMCRAHYNMDFGGTWYTGGSSHNDDRLTAQINDRGEIKVTDNGQCLETYTGELTPDAIDAYVEDWLESVWAA